ncbi:ROK family protein [Paenibacillus sp. Marseille-Q7038]
MSHYIAIDIGGTGIKYAVITRGLKMVHEGQLPTATTSLMTKIPEQVFSIIEVCLSLDIEIKGVGISTAGVVDLDTGEIRFAGLTMPGYAGTKLKQWIEERYSLPVNVLNDVNAAAAGEQCLGAGKGFSHFFCMTLGTGIGGALVLDHKIVYGAHGRSGEIGHTLYEPASNTTYEQRASMRALMERAKEQLSFQGDGSELFQLAKDGHSQAMQLIDDWCKEIAAGIVNIIYVFDPQAVIIGGAVSKQGDFLLKKLEKELTNALPVSFVLPVLSMAALGNQAALYGAIHYFLIMNQEEC